MATVKELKAGVSSVSPLSERINELGVVLVLRSDSLATAETALIASSSGSYNFSNSKGEVVSAPNVCFFLLHRVSVIKCLKVLALSTLFPSRTCSH